jgi:hypothetical protein
MHSYQLEALLELIMPQQFQLALLSFLRCQVLFKTAQGFLLVIAFFFLSFESSKYL